VASAVLCDIFIGDSLKQKLDSLSDTVTDNVRGTGTFETANCVYVSVCLNDKARSCYMSAVC